MVSLCPVGVAGRGVGSLQSGLQDLAQTKVSVGGRLHVIPELVRQGTGGTVTVTLYDII